MRTLRAAVLRCDIDLAIHRASLCADPEAALQIELDDLLPEQQHIVNAMAMGTDNPEEATCQPSH